MKDKTYLHTKPYWNTFLVGCRLQWLPITYVDIRRIIEDYDSLSIVADGKWFI